MKASYNDVKLPTLGFQGFAPTVAARGPMLSARTRLRLHGQPPEQPAGATERDLY